MSPAESTFWDAVDGIRERDPRYPREAYGFVVAALGAVVERLPEERRRDPLRRHLSGAELTSGVIALARREFGLMATAVFREWGLASAEDIGRVVFHLVESGQLSARPEDRIEDFAGGPDLADALTRGLETGEDLDRGLRARRARSGAPPESL